MRNHFVRYLFAFVVALLFIGQGTNSYAAIPRYWSVNPYSVRIELIPDGSVVSDPSVIHNIIGNLQERCDVRLRPLWKTEVVQLSQQNQRAAKSLLAIKFPEADALPLEEGAERPDKRILVHLSQKGSRLDIRCREFDTTLKRWGLLYEKSIGQIAQIEESLLEAVTQTFSPMVAVELNTADPSIVDIQIRGNQLTTAKSLGKLKPGTILLPFLRKVDRQGSPIPGGLDQLAWTYLKIPEDGEKFSDEPVRPGYQRAKVYSHVRLPFGTRRRGRIQQLAISVLSDPEVPTELQLYAQQDESIPLEGFEVFIGKPGQGKDLTRLGRTNQFGSITIPKSNEVLMAHVKSGSTVVASLPVAPGVNPVLRTPLLDERQRLAAESKLSAMRERLIDVVAQRQILISRIRRRLSDEDLETAETLLQELESLPGQAQFSRELKSAEQKYKADNALVQRRLDRIFSQTRAVLGAALDAREIRLVSNEVMDARAANSGG